MVVVGDTLPKECAFTVRKTDTCPATTDTVTVEQVFGGKRSVIFAVPGAFTPTCSEKHLPGFVALADELKAAGAEVIACVSVNDPFVMLEWGKAHNAQDKVLMLADGLGAFSAAIGELGEPAPAKGFNPRSSRYAIVVDKDFKVEVVLKEKGAFGETSAESVLAQLKGQK